MEYTCYRDLSENTIDNNSNDKSSLLQSIKYKIYGSIPQRSSVKSKSNRIYSLIKKYRDEFLNKIRGCKYYFPSKKKDNP